METDDPLTGKLVAGVVDFAEICVSLGLREQLTLLVKVLAVTARRLLETSQHTRELAEIGQMVRGAALRVIPASTCSTHYFYIGPVQRGPVPVSRHLIFN